MSKTALALHVLIRRWCDFQRQHYRHIRGWEDLQ